MTDFYDALQFREHNGKWRATRLGYAKPNKKGDGYDIYLDALPIPIDGTVRISIQPQRKKGKDESGEVPF